MSSRAENLGLPYADTNLIPIDKDDVNFRRRSPKFRVAVIHRLGKTVTLALIDPSEANQGIYKKPEEGKRLANKTLSSRLPIWSASGKDISKLFLWTFWTR